MRVLVTGGAGLIGSHLVDRLLQLGHHVVCLDDFSTGSRDNLTPHPRLAMLEHDVTIPERIEVERIYNLACPAAPRHYQLDPVRTVRTSVLGVTNMLDLCRATGARLLQASTSEVYGDPTVHPQPESYWGNVNPIGLRACYDEGKRAAETLCMDYHRQYGVEIRIARIFNTYGPRMALEDGRVIGNFLLQALRGDPITIYGDGRQTRSFCYVDDLVEGLLLLMEHPDLTGPVNLGNDHEVSVRDLAETIVRLAASGSELRFEPLPADDPVRRKPDLTMARERLGYAPIVPLTEGLRRTLAELSKRVTAGREPPR